MRPQFIFFRISSYKKSNKAIRLSLKIIKQDFSAFSSPNEKDLRVFFQILGKEGVVTDSEILKPLNIDWLHKWEGQSQVALFPSTSIQVSQILSHCNKRKLPVVPQGGNTGLVGGSIPVNDEIILCTKRMNKILHFDPFSGVLTCEAGCTLEQLDLWLNERSHTMPLDLGAKGTCQIGGNISTNAGGLRYVRYGSLHGSLLGLEVVLADGSVLNLMSEMKKNNTGYSLKNVFVGAEGTLGVITKVSMAVPVKPTSTQVAFLAFRSFEDVKSVLVQAKSSLGEILSAIEVIDAESMKAVEKTMTHLKNPFEKPSMFYLLIETQGSNGQHDNEKLESFLELGFQKGTIENGVVAQDNVQAKKLWALRENCPVALTHIGYIYKYDLSLTIDNFYEVVDVIRERLKDTGALVVCFGHIGDCNVHLNVVTPTKCDAVLEKIEPFLFEWVVSKGGSISAEHGVGQHKLKYMDLIHEPAVLQSMAALKQVFDPHRILNPFKFCHHP